MTLELPPKKVVYQGQIELRLLSPKDGPAIYCSVIASLPELRHFMNWAHFENDLHTACAIYAELEAKSLKGEEVHFAGYDLKTKKFLFACSLTPASRLNPHALELGYWVASAQTGKGLGTIAAKLLISLAFRYYKANRLSAVCNPENSRSLKVIEKCGFRLEGRLRNHLDTPTATMLAKGYSPISDSLSFSLIPEDLPSLNWFEDFYSKLSIVRYDQEKGVIAKPKP